VDDEGASENMDEDADLVGLD